MRDHFAVFFGIGLVGLLCITLANTQTAKLDDIQTQLKMQYQNLTLEEANMLKAYPALNEQAQKDKRSLDLCNESKNNLWANLNFGLVLLGVLFGVMFGVVLTTEYKDKEIEKKNEEINLLKQTKGGRK